MADESERWAQAQKDRENREPFQAKASAVALHTDPQRRRNLDKEEAERDRLIFRWVMMVGGFLLLVGLLFFVIGQLNSSAAG